LPTFFRQHFSEVLPTFFLVNIFRKFANIFSHQLFWRCCQYFFVNIF
jgi:hypothetical protein